MINSAGEEFFNQQQDDPLAFGPYTVQLKALAKQVHAGKARYDGGYFAGFDHCSPAEVETYTTYGKTYRQLGLRFPQQMVETAVTSHYRQGGIDVDTSTMRSSVPGLYVAGGLGGHSNGLIGLATYDGKVVADGVTRDLPELNSSILAKQEIELESRRLEQLRHSSAAGSTPIEVKERVRALMWEKVGVEKSPTGHAIGARRDRADSPRSAAQHTDLKPSEIRELRMAGRHRRREHDRCVRTDHLFVAGTQREQRAVLSPGLSPDGQ